MWKKVFKIYRRWAYCLFLLSLMTTVSAANQNTPVSIRQVVWQVLEEHPTMVASKEMVRSAKWSAQGFRRPVYNPELEVETETEKGEEFDFVVGASQSIDVYGKRESRSKVAGNSLIVAQLEQAAVQHRLAIHTLEWLIDYNRTLKQKELATRRVTLLEQVNTIVHKRFKQGDITEVDLDQANIALASALKAKQDAIESFIAAETVLTEGTMITDSEWPKMLPTVPDRQQFKGADSHQAEKHPEVQLAKAAYSETVAQVENTRIENRADPTIGIGVGREDEENLVALRFSIPILVRNDFSEATKAAQHKSLAVEQRFFNRWKKQTVRLRLAEQRLQAAKESWQAWKQATKSSLTDGNERLVRLWKAGEITMTDYLTQLERRVEAEVEQVELHYAVWNAFVSWLDHSATWTDWLNISRFELEEKKEAMR